MKRLEKLQMDKAFDPVNPDSRPTPAQQAIFDDLRDIELQPGEFYPAVQYRYVVAGNQCKPAYSLVKMADNTLKPIIEVQEGDVVLAYDKKLDKQVPSTVIKKWNNGVKDVHRYYINGTYTDSTPNHEMLSYLGGKLVKRRLEKCTNLVQEVHTYESVDTLDSKKVELLGYLLGDGCFRINRPNGSWKGLQFTNTNEEIISHVENLLDSDYKLRRVGNGDFFISKRNIENEPKTNRYVSFIRELGLDNLLAHEKFIPEEVFHQSIDTRRRFIAGLIATDGCVQPRRIQFYSTSDKLAKGLVRLYASIGIYAVHNIRPARQPQHRDEHCVQISRSQYYNLFARTIKVPSKPCLIEREDYRPVRCWASTDIDNSEYLGQMEVYDITIDHHDHTYVCDGFYTGNSGKSTLAAREIAWVVTDTHPTWTRPARWGEEPLLVLIAGQDRRMMELELWTKKIKPFLNATDWREVRVGGMLTFCEHRHLGHKIVFVSHNDSSESNRAHLQGYVSHYVWLDEMPRKITILEELQRRVDARRGYFIATFTPKSRNEAIRKVVEAATPPMGKRYRLSKLDNPLYASNREAELRKLDGYTEDQKATILYGDWTGGDNFVYQFDAETMVVDQLPGHYSKSWRHTVAVDPALKSKFGFTLWAEDPAQGTWYLVKDDYIEGIYSPDDIVNSVQKLCAGYNIVRRISDPHESWFIGQAAKYKLNYIHPLDKSNRKPELIKNLQIALSTGKIKIAAWCKTFIEEIQNCQFQEGSEKIINSSSYHTLDASQYFVDLIPPYDESQRAKPWEQELREKNAERKLRDSKDRIATANQQRTGRILNLRGAWR